MNNGFRIFREHQYPERDDIDEPQSPQFKMTDSLPRFGYQSSRPDVKENIEPTRGRKLDNIPMTQSQYTAGKNNTNPVAESIVINIKLGDRNDKQIRCNPDDDPKWLAAGFCRKYEVSEQAIPLIVKEIKRQIKAYRKKREEAQNLPMASQFTFSPKRDNYEEIRDSITSGARKSAELDENIQSDAPSVRIYKGKPIAKLNIDLGSDEPGVVSIYKGEEPGEVAWRFCQENNLPKPAYDYLFKSLKNLVDKHEAKQQQKAGKKYSAPSESMKTETEPSPPQSIQRKKSEQPIMPIQTPKASIVPELKVPAQIEEPLPVTATKTNVQKEQPDHLVKSWEKWQKVITTKVKRGKDGRPSIPKNGPESPENKQFFDMAESYVAKAKGGKSPEKEEEPKKMSKEEIMKSSQRMFETARYKEERLARQREEEAEQKKIQKEREAAFEAERQAAPINRSKSSGPPILKYMNIQEEIAKKHKNEQLRIQNLILECPFKPTLDRKTEEIALSRPRSKSPIHDRLYYEGLAHEKHMEEWREMAMNEIYKFHPTLNDDVEKFLSKRPKLSTIQFIESLYQWKRDKETRQIAKYMEENNGIDHKTGQPRPPSKI